MLNDYSLKFIKLFINNQLKLTPVISELNNIFIINDFARDLDEIIDTIHINPSFIKYTRIQIIYQLSLETSYNYPYICNYFLTRYMQDLEKKIQVPDPLWDIFTNLYRHVTQDENFAWRFFNSWRHIMLILANMQNDNQRDQAKIDNIKCFKLKNDLSQFVDNNDIKYSLFKSNNDKDNFDSEKIQYLIKQTIISIHKLFNNLSDKQKCLLTSIESLLLFYKIYIPEFYSYIILYYKSDLCFSFSFSQKDQRLFVNILANMLIKLFITYQSIDIRPKYGYGEDLILDTILSRWHLLNSRNKHFFKQYKEQLISYLLHGKLNFCEIEIEIEIEKELFVDILNNLEE